MSYDVVVGVDGGSASANAIRYARAEAARTGGEVEVLTVIPDFVPVPGLFALPPEDLTAAGRSALRAALDQAGPGDVRVHTEVRHGNVVASLCAAGRDARTVVVGSDRRPVSLRLLTGNVSTGVSARAQVPVVSVPDTWSADRATGTVLVGVEEPGHADDVLAAGFDVASRRGSRLLVLHAWRLPAAYDEVGGTDPATLRKWGARSERELAASLTAWQTRHPEVPVELRCVHDQAVHALVVASREVDELVMVRRAHGFPAAAHLGSIARGVLLYAQCPVRVVPGVRADARRTRRLEAAGAPR